MYASTRTGHKDPHRRGIQVCSLCFLIWTLPDILAKLVSGIAFLSALCICRLTRSQPAIEAVTLSLMQRFNKLPSNSTSSSPSELEAVQPLIYNTFQAYLRRHV
jgi:hypothetical protein